MVETQEVKTKKQQKEFLNFPLELYKNNEFFVPPLYGDEKQIFKKDYMYYDQAEAIYFIARRDGKVVGRISGILQNAANEKWQRKQVRFTRFDWNTTRQSTICGSCFIRNSTSVVVALSKNCRTLVFCAKRFTKIFVPVFDVWDDKSFQRVFNMGS